MTLNLGATGGEGGDGAFAIVAQSIAGGGGIGGYSTAGSTIATELGTPPTSAGKGNADEVQVYTGPSVSIQTDGDSGHGIIAQSIGSGGGIVPLDGGTAYFGSTNPSSSAGIGRPVTVTNQGELEIEGDNAVGIFAQSTSGSGTGSTITIEIADGGTIYQASVFAPAPAVWVDGGDASNSFYADPSTSVFTYGTTVKYSGNASISIDNEGIFAGDVQTENDFGVLGTMVNRGDFSIGRDSAVNLTNAGTMRIGDHLPDADFVETTLQGDFTQTAAGELHLDADFVGGRSDRLIVTGAADLAGELMPKISGLVLDRELRFLQAGGDVSGSFAVDFAAEPELFELEVRRDNGMTMRSYLRGGVSLATEDRWQQDARFASAPVSAGDFTTTLPMDDVSGLITAGLQLQINENASVFLQYEGEYSEDVTGNGGGAGVKVVF